MQIDLQPIWDTWAIVGHWFSKPGVWKALTILVGVMAFILLVMFWFVPWIINRYIDEVTDRLFDEHHGKFRVSGIPQASLRLIATCLGWVFGLKICAELVEPFVAIALPASAERHWWVTRYDWLVLVALVVLVLAFWTRFLWDVKKYDRAKADNSKIDRKLSRTFPLFWKPAVALLVLLFVPDLGKRATSVAADVVKSAIAADAADAGGK